MPGSVADDLVQPFQIDPFGLRGRLVRLGPLLDEILTRFQPPRESPRGALPWGEVLRDAECRCR